MTAYATGAELAEYLGSADVTATATATLDGDAVDALTIGAGGGYGYTETPLVVIEAPETGVRATATATVANGVVSELTLTGGGSGYVEAPAVTIDPPVDSGRLLERASELLDGVVIAPFTVDDETGLPEDADYAAALRDACCAQVEFWLEVGEENDVDGLAGSAFSVTGYQGKRAPKVAPRALGFLRDAGLMT